MAVRAGDCTAGGARRRCAGSLAEHVAGLNGRDAAVWPDRDATHCGGYHG